MVRKKEPDATRLLEAGGEFRGLHRRAKGFADQEHVPAAELRVLTRDTVVFFEALAPEIANALRERILEYDTLRDAIDELSSRWIMDSANSRKVKVSGKIYIRPARYRTIVGIFASELPAIFCCLLKPYQEKLKKTHLFSEAAAPSWQRVEAEVAHQHQREVLDLLRSAPEGETRDRAAEFLASWKASSTPRPEPLAQSTPPDTVHETESAELESRPIGRYDPERERLLQEYKRATGASHVQIYTARNSGINKPEFYKWRRGELPETSITTRNFERFLREKRPPMPRRANR